MGALMLINAIGFFLFGCLLLCSVEEDDKTGLIIGFLFILIGAADLIVAWCVS